MIPLLSTLAGCESEPARPAAVESASAPLAPRPPCGAAQVEEHRKWLVGSCTEPQIFDTPALASATWNERDELGGGVIVRLPAAGLLIDGRPERFDAAALRTLLREQDAAIREMAAAKDQPLQPWFVLAIHGDTPLSYVDTAVRTLADEGKSRGTIVFASATLPRSAKPRYPEAHARAMAELQTKTRADERASFLARQIEPFALRCPALSESFASVASMDPATRCVALMTLVAQDLVDCGCPDFEPEIVSWLQLLAGPPDMPVLHANTVELRPERAERAAPDTTWAAFVATHRAPMRTLWLDLAR